MASMLATASGDVDTANRHSENYIDASNQVRICHKIGLFDMGRSGFGADGAVIA